MLDVSRPTVRRALGILIGEGLIERVPGRGTFVRDITALPVRARTGAVGLIVPEMRDAFIADMAMGAEDVISRHDGHLVFCNANNEVGEERKYLSELWQAEKVDGFLLATADAPQPHQTLRNFVDDGVPVVLMDRYFADLDVPYVVSDNLRGGYLATRHLIDLGYRHIGFITRPNLYVSSVAHRLQGYKQALSEAGLEFDPGLICQGLLPYMSEMDIPRLAEYDRGVIAEFLGHQCSLCAVVACNDLIAAQVVAVCHATGVHIPHDLALVSFDDDPIATLLHPQLTTVRQHAYEMGARAASILLDVLDGQSVERQVVLPVELVVRQSCGAATS